MDEVDLAPTQWLYVLARFEGQTITAAAKAAGVSRWTGSQWEKHPDIQAKIAELNTDRVDSIQAFSLGEVTGSLAALAAIRDNPEASDNAKINASKALINGAALIHQLFSKEARIRELEQLLEVED